MAGRHGLGKALRAALVVLAALAGAARAATDPSPPPQARFAFRNLEAPVTAAWTAVPPSSGYRAAQYRVPAAPGAGEGEVVVFYFGAGQGGSAAANIERWSGQFSSADGSPVAAKVRTLRIDGMPATIAELSGHYARGVGMARDVRPKPDQTLIAAVVETPHGNLTFQLHGDTATVDLHRAAFLALVGGLKAR